MFTLDELKDMSKELNWSGTAGFNIDTQRKLVDTLIEYIEEEQRKEKEESMF